MLNVELQGPNDGTGETLRQSLLTRDKHPGAVVYTKPVFEYEPAFIPFVNPTLGISMNQNVTFGGTPELIFDGGSGGIEWTGSGATTFNFASVGKVVLTNGANNDEALFEDTGTHDTSNHTALTGKVDLDTYTPGSQDVLFRFGLAGTPLGVSLSMNDYIDTGNFAEQGLVIPLEDFVLGGGLVDEFTMTVQRSGGPAPDISFDDFQIEETGDPLSFRASSTQGDVFIGDRLSIILVDAQSTTLTGGTMPNLSYDKLLGVSALANGITFKRVENGETRFSASISQLSDFLFTGSDIKSTFSDGTNTTLVLEASFVDPFILSGNPINNYIEFTINDDLSGLLLFNAGLRGSSRI